MATHPPDLSLPTEPQVPNEPGGVPVGGLAVALAVVWLLVAVSMTLLVGGAWFVGELIGQTGPAQLDRRALTLIGGTAMSLIAFRLAWLLLDGPSSRRFLSSLIAAVAILGLAIVVQLVQGQIKAGPDLFLLGFLVLVSGLAVWQSR